MRIDGSVALVTGANRGLGRAYADGLLAAGAAKVYAGVRDPASVAGAPLEAVALDVTDAQQVRSTAERLSDVQIVISNAGVMSLSRPLTASLDAARWELEVNYLGLLAVAQAFAPVLAANGGGALVNVLSYVSFVARPHMSTYAASKAAAWSITNSLRTQLGEQGTQVVSIHMGVLDTGMGARLPDEPKLPARHVVDATLAALRTGEEEVLVGEKTRLAKSALHDDQRLIYPEIREGFEHDLPL
jgi:NAD(P)-dependent dehydrogenase (short-subunit alcohol dehydrogenase family)